MGTRAFFGWISGVCAYTLIACMTVYDGFLTIVFQPIAGALFSGVATIVISPIAWLIGLIRSVRHPAIGFTVACLGFASILYSASEEFVTYETIPETGESFRNIHMGFAGAGFFFCILGPMLLQDRPRFAAPAQSGLE